MKKPCIICEQPVEVLDNFERPLHPGCRVVAAICCTSAEDGLKAISSANLGHLETAFDFELHHGARKTLLKALARGIKKIGNHHRPRQGKKGFEPDAENKCYKPGHCCCPACVYERRMACEN